MVKRRKKSIKPKQSIDSQLKKEMLSFYKKQNVSQKVKPKKILNLTQIGIILIIAVALTLLTQNLKFSNKLIYIIFSITIFASFLFILLNFYNLIYAEDEDKRIAYTNIFLAFLTSIILLGQFYVFSEQSDTQKIQTKILEKQTEILEKSSPPYEATMEILITEYNLNIPVWELNDVRDLELDPENRWAEIDFSISNYGLADSKIINCRVDMENDSLYVYMKPDSYIKNIPSQDSQKFKLHILYGDCYKGNEEGCNKDELIPIGKQKIFFNCICDNCKTHYNFNDSFEICIYSNNTNYNCP